MLFTKEYWEKGWERKVGEFVSFKLILFGKYSLKEEFISSFGRFAYLLDVGFDKN